MDCSFTSQGDWFVFNAEGKTLSRGFKTKALALVWIREHERAR
jgi:hypothetical protein